MNKESNNIEQIKSSKYGEYFTHLQNINEKQRKELQLKEQVFEILKHDFHKDLHQLLSELLGYFQNGKFSSARFVVIFKQFPKRNNTISEGTGSNCNEYAYLDEQIEAQLGKPGILFIPDTTKIHSIKFISRSKFPRTILAISLEINPEKSGMIWFACEDQRIFSKAESDSHIAFAEACASVIRLCIEWNENINDLNFRNDILNLGYFPFFILSKDDVIFSNLKAKQMYKNILERNNDKVEFLRNIWDLKTEKDQSISINDKDYQILFIDSFQNFGESCRAVILIDDTMSQQQQGYISLVIDSISQGLRSPLNQILGSIKMLPLVGEVNNHQQSYINTIQGKTEDSLAIVEELFNLERVINNTGLRIQEIDIKSLIEISCALVGHLANQKRISILNISSNSEEMIKVDKVLFSQALANILEYAISQTSLGGEINIFVESRDENWCISITDSSNGFSQVEVDRLNSCEILREIPQSLLLVRRIVSFHGGFFMIQSSFGKGNTYNIKIPKL
jgi:signal transduction histidine kinase